MPPSPARSTQPDSATKVPAETSISKTHAGVSSLRFSNSDTDRLQDHQSSLIKGKKPKKKSSKEMQSPPKHTRTRVAEAASSRREKCADVTPRSSWESFDEENVTTKTHESTDPLVQSNNPFRRAIHSKQSDLFTSTYKKEASMNPWQDQPRNTPQPITPYPSHHIQSAEPIHNPKATEKQPLSSMGAESVGRSTQYTNPLQQSGLGATELKHNQYLLSGQQNEDPKSGEPRNHGEVSNSSFAGSLNFNVIGRPVTSGSGSSNYPDRLPDMSKTLPELPPRPEKVQSVEQRDTKSSQGHPVASSHPSKTVETYQVRLVNWIDSSAPSTPRRSPIMVQNANGPCPLLALVNALVLSTPASVTTALVETLRVREQVSLGLLLEAVIDELMSGRRGDATQNLPDVSDLHGFLVNLHTGMNVNPRFVSSNEEINLMDAPIDALSTAHDFRKAGGFEETRELKLYSTFAIPLIHGWIPPQGHPAYAALKRNANTYEDAQNLLFREDELEDKLKLEGLSEEDQSLLQDIASIKYFLSSTATQLTGYGLDTITDTIAPGSVVILFRNDHFSTLYRHPQSGQILSLVTDMGYSGHDEVVWESLVDVSGEGSEFYSGEFQPVGNLSAKPAQQRVVGREQEAGWTTVQRASRNKNTKNRSSQPKQNDSMPPLADLNLDEVDNGRTTSPEQDDHDFALALQLQEEEDERHKQESAARRREDELSQQYLSNTNSSGRRTFPGWARGASNGPNVPPRGGSSTQPLSTGRRPVVRQNYTDDAPPSYEQAAKGPAYHPPVDYPPSLESSRQRPTPLQPQRTRGVSAYSEHAASYAGSPMLNPAGVRSPRARNSSYQTDGSSRNAAISTGADGERKEKDCIVM